MPGPTRNDPFTGRSFLVEIDGITASAFKSVGGLNSETEILEYRTGASFTSHKLPGRTTWGNLVLSHGITKDAELWNWRQSVVEGVTQRRNGTITLLDDSLKPVLRWRFVDGWPCKWDGPELDASKNEVAIETLEIAHEGLSLVT